MKARRLPVHDRVDRSGEAVVLVGERVVRLSALATVLLDHCDEWTEADHLAAVLVSAFGPPEGTDPIEATQGALLGLATEGLVELG